MAVQHVGAMPARELNSPPAFTFHISSPGNDDYVPYGRFSHGFSSCSGVSKDEGGAGRGIQCVGLNTDDHWPP